MNKLHSQVSYILLKSEFLEMKLSKSLMIWFHNDLTLKNIKFFYPVALPPPPNPCPPRHPTMETFLSHIKSESQSYNLEKCEQKVLSSVPFQNQYVTLPTFILKLSREWSMA